MTTPAHDAAITELIAVMRRVRNECAWTREQTHESLAPYALEEAGEVRDTIEDPRHGPAELRDELGDLLLQVVFHAAIAEEAGEFTFDDVAAAITSKLVRRNRHVFDPRPGEENLTSAQISDLWDSIKAAERTTGP